MDIIKAFQHYGASYSPVPIILFIMLLSNTPKFSLSYSNYAPMCPVILQLCSIVPYYAPLCSINLLPESED